jgi:phosphoribosyl-ATP pyrophosphohydrolase
MFDSLFKIIEGRKKEKPPGSYTAQLMDAGENQILRKIGEETLEVIFAAKDEGQQRLVEESADLIYHLWVLLSYKGVDLALLKSELSTRHKGEQ